MVDLTDRRVELLTWIFALLLLVFGIFNAKVVEAVIAIVLIRFFLILERIERHLR